MERMLRAVRRACAELTTNRIGMHDACETLDSDGVLYVHAAGPGLSTTKAVGVFSELTETFGVTIVITLRSGDRIVLHGGAVVINGHNADKREMARNLKETAERCEKYDYAWSDMATDERKSVGAWLREFVGNTKVCGFTCAPVHHLIGKYGKDVENREVVHRRGAVWIAIAHSEVVWETLKGIRNSLSSCFCGGARCLEGAWEFFPDSERVMEHIEWFDGCMALAIGLCCERLPNLIRIGEGNVAVKALEALTVGRDGAWK